MGEHGLHQQDLQVSCQIQLERRLLIDAPRASGGVDPGLREDGFLRNSRSLDSSILIVRVICAFTRPRPGRFTRRHRRTMLSGRVEQSARLIATTARADPPDRSARACRGAAAVTGLVLRQAQPRADSRAPRLNANDPRLQSRASPSRSRDTLLSAWRACSRLRAARCTHIAATSASPTPEIHAPVDTSCGS